MKIKPYFRLQRSLIRGPARLSVSKSGISTSLGNRIIRITKLASGKRRMIVKVPIVNIGFELDI